jgi:hypothetical protein
LTWNILGRFQITAYDAIVLGIAALLGYFFWSSWLVQMHQLGRIEPPRRSTKEV